MSSASPTRSNIAAAINAAHAGVEAAKCEGARYAVECGRLLAEAKETVPHGGWDTWLKASTSVSPRTAQLYMRLARHVGDDPAKAQRVAGLSVREAAAEAAGAKRKRAPRKPLGPEYEVWAAELDRLWAEGRPEWREEWVRRLHARGEVTLEQRDRLVAGAYHGLTAEERQEAGGRWAALLLRHHRGEDAKAITAVMRRFAGQAPAIALGDALWRPTL